jgi:hypothetical protein
MLIPSESVNSSEVRQAEYCERVAKSIEGY